MAAGSLAARLFLVCVLSEVSHSSALPRARHSLQPRAGQDGRGERGVYGNPHPFRYMTALRQTNGRLHPNVRDRVQVKALRPYRPRSNVPTQRPVETSVFQPRAHRSDPLAQPRSFDLSLQIPFAHGHHGASRYRPSGFYIYNSFNDPLRNHDVPKPGYQFSISVPASPQHHPGRAERPGDTGSGDQTQQQLSLPSDRRPSSSPLHSRQHFEQTGHDGPLDQDLESPKPDVPKHPPRYHYPPEHVAPFSGYYSSQRNPWHDFWRHYWGHYHGPHHGPFWSHAQHSSSEPWPDLRLSD